MHRKAIVGGTGLLFVQDNHRGAITSTCSQLDIAPITLGDLWHTYAALARQGIPESTAIQAARTERA